MAQSPGLDENFNGLIKALDDRIKRLEIASAKRTPIRWGSGVPTLPNGVAPTAGDYYFRTDTPTTANQRIYVCSVGGGTPTWVGIV